MNAPLNPDDPRLTAYALDELSPAERAELDPQLRRSVECQSEVEATRQFAAELTRELADEPCPAWTTEPMRTLTRPAMAQDAPTAARSETEGALGSLVASWLRSPWVWLTAAATVLAILAWPSRDAFAPRTDPSAPEATVSVARTTERVAPSPTPAQNPAQKPAPSLPASTQTEQPAEPDVPPQALAHITPRGAADLAATEPNAPAPANAVLTGEPPPAAPETASSISSPAPVAAASVTPTPVTPPEAMPASRGVMAAIPIQLPAPAFQGTPIDIPPDTDAEKPSDRPRPPFFAPAGAQNVSLRKKVTSSDPSPISGTLDLITDGDKEATETSLVELHRKTQWIQIDLHADHEIYAIFVWHRHSTPAIYRDVVVQLSSSPDFLQDVQTVFNNDKDNSSGLGAGTDREYFESYEGKLIDSKGARGRYVRCYSKGSTESALNDYTEVEVWGQPVSSSNTTRDPQPAGQVRIATPLPAPAFH